MSWGVISAALLHFLRTTRVNTNLTKLQSSNEALKKLRQREKTNTKDLLFPLTLRNNALNLVESAIGAGRAMLNNIAAHFTRTTALASFGSSPLDAFGRTNTVGLQSGITRRPLVRRIVMAATMQMRAGGCAIRGS